MSIFHLLCVKSFQSYFWFVFFCTCTIFRVLMFPNNVKPPVSYWAPDITKRNRVPLNEPTTLKSEKQWKETASHCFVLQREQDKAFKGKKPWRLPSTTSLCHIVLVPSAEYSVPVSPSRAALPPQSVAAWVANPRPRSSSGPPRMLSLSVPDS